MCGRIQEPQSDGGQGQENVDEGQAQHHLHDHVEDEEAVDEVEHGQQQGHAHAPRLHAGHQGAEGGAEQVSGGDVEGDGYESGHGVGHVQDQGAPPQGRCGGNEAEDQAGDHLPPSRLTGPQVLGDDEAQPHPAEDDDKSAGRDGPDDHPRLAHQVVGVGEVRRGAGEDVAHGAGFPPAVVGVLARGPLHDTAEGPVDALDHPAGEGSRPASGVEGGQNLVPDAARLMEGDDGVEVASLAVLGLGQHHQQVGPVAVELRVLVQVGVLPRVLPSVAAASSRPP